MPPPIIPALPHTPVDLSIHHSCSQPSVPRYTTTVLPSAPMVIAGSPTTPVVIEPQSVHTPVVALIDTLRNSPAPPRAVTCNPPLDNTIDGSDAMFPAIAPALPHTPHDLS